MLKGRKLLDKEEEYIKLNAVLDEERQGLLKQLDDVMTFNEHVSEEETQIELNDGTFMQSSDIYAEKWTIKKREDTGSKKSFSASNASRISDKNERHLPTQLLGAIPPQYPKLTRHKSEVRIRERFDNSLVPDTVKNMGQDGVMRFLRAKVQILSEQLEAVQKDEKKLLEKVKDLQSDRERVSEDRDKWIQQATMAKNVLIKHEQHASSIVMQLQNTQAENGHLKREIEKLRKELKQTIQSSGSNELRLNRSIEEVERLKNTLRQMKQEEKELKENSKKKSEELTIALKKIEKQKVELLHAFKKQLVVIDNLKKQKGLAESGKLLKSIEDDFMEFLDWNPSKE